MTLDGIELPDDLLWVDEFDWNPVVQETDRTLTGALMIQEQKKLLGRGITLTGNEVAGWVSKEIVDRLMTICEEANKTMTLTLPDNRQFLVVFDRKNGRPITAEQLQPFAYPDDNYFYNITMRLMIVARNN